MTVITVCTTFLSIKYSNFVNSLTNTIRTTIQIKLD